jgi:Fe-S cluster assembly ATP-binding protein
VPDFVHVLAGGRNVRTGGRELAQELEERGYGWVDEVKPTRSGAAA